MKAKITSIGVTCIFICSCSTGQPPANNEYLNAEVFTNPAKLETEADENSVAFENKYAGRYVIVIGSIKGIDPEGFSVARQYQYYNRDVGIHVPQTAEVGCNARADKNQLLTQIKEGGGVIAAGRLDFSAGGILELINLRDCVWAIAEGTYDIDTAKDAIASSLGAQSVNSVHKSATKKAWDNLADN